MPIKRGGGKGVSCQAQKDEKEVCLRLGKCEHTGVTAKVAEDTGNGCCRDLGGLGGDSARLTTVEEREMQRREVGCRWEDRRKLGAEGTAGDRDVHS